MRTKLSDKAEEARDSLQRLEISLKSIGRKFVSLKILRDPSEEAPLVVESASIFGQDAGGSIYSTLGNLVDELIEIGKSQLNDNYQIVIKPYR